MPIGLIGLFISIIFWTTIFISETIIVFICFPIAAIFSSRIHIESSFIGNYPNSNPIENISENIQNIWGWVFDTW